jgi:hypothetical protein
MKNLWLKHNEFSTNGDNGVVGDFAAAGDNGHAVASLDFGDLCLIFELRGVLNGDGGVHILGSMSSRLWHCNRRRF